MAVLAPAIGWLIPGAGHMIQKRWIRGLLLMVSVVAMFVLGLEMQGRIYKPNGGNILDICVSSVICAPEECTLCVARSISAMLWSRMLPRTMAQPSSLFPAC